MIFCDYVIFAVGQFSMSCSGDRSAFALVCRQFRDVTALLPITWPMRRWHPSHSPAVTNVCVDPRDIHMISEQPPVNMQTLVATDSHINAATSKPWSLYPFVVDHIKFSRLRTLVLNDVYIHCKDFPIMNELETLYIYLVR